MTTTAILHTPSRSPQANDAVAHFVASIIWGDESCFEHYSTLAVTRNGELIAGVVYHNYDNRAGVLEVSCGSIRKDWASRDIVRQMFAVPFNMLNCQAVIARHSADAKHLRRIWKAFGADEYPIPRLRGRGKPDEIIAVLTIEAWNASKFMRQV